MPPELILRMGTQKPSFYPEDAMQPFNRAKNPVMKVFLRNSYLCRSDFNRRFLS
jgi:hypothetical protein